MSTLKTAKWCPLVPFTSTYHTKQPNPRQNSSASPVVNYSRLSACQGELEPFEGHSNTHGHLTSLRNKSSLSNFQHQYLAELLVNVYSYCSMVKSVSCYSVHGRWIFLNSVTYILSDPSLIGYTLTWSTTCSLKS